MEKSLMEVKTETMESQEKTIKKRGRPKKSSQSTQSKKSKNNETIKPIGIVTSFKSIFSFTGKILAVSMEYKDFELSENESTVLAEQAESVTLEFAPNIENKWIKLILFVTSLIGIFGKKYTSFAMNDKKENTKENLKKVEIVENV